MQCEYCGRALSPQDWQCPGCGAPVSQHKNVAGHNMSQQNTINQNTHTQDMGNREYVNNPYRSTSIRDVLRREDYGGFWRRLMACWIDGIILGLVCGILPVFGTLLACCYWIIGESSICNGATIGKRAMGIKVVGSDFQTLSVMQSLARNLCKIISYAICCIGFFWIIGSERRQALHDRICGCYVVRTRK